MTTTTGTTHATGSDAFPHVFEPVQVGTMWLRNRVMLPPHASAIGNLWGSDSDARRNIAYWESRAKAGAAWIDIPGRIRNLLIPGFEPHGYSAETTGHFRLPFFVERVQELVSAIHAAGAVVTCQMTHIGGVPHAPSPRLSAPIYNFRPHVLHRDDIAWYVEEYRFSARQARAAGLDGIEIHMNHEDLIEWFLSPYTNHRDDEYGGSLENRARFAVEVLAAVREEIGREMTLGVRLNAREEMPGGYDVPEGIAIAQHLAATGLIDFLHIVVGSTWGDPSYIQPQYYAPAQWSNLAGEYRKAVSLPVIYSGRVNSIEVAERVLADGHADIVGMARAFIADGELLVKARENRLEDIRPCIGGNDCISRRYVEGLPFGCPVNPHTSNEIDGPWPKAKQPRRLLVVGGGPAGMELAALAAESGHRVQLWEAADQLGGQLRVAAAAPSYDQYQRYLDWQIRRLERVGVEVRLGTRATADTVIAAGADVVAVATGATPHRPSIPGVDLPNVLEIRDVLRGRAVPGQRVLIVAEDDHLAPLSLADFLSEKQHKVTVVYPTPGPAQLLGRYIVGGILARLYSRNVTFRFMEQVTAIGPDHVQVTNIYSRRSEELTGVDSVVLACGGDADDALYHEVRARHPEVHVLGDAFAPRRLVYATRQAYALAKLLLD